MVTQALPRELNVLRQVRRLPKYNAKAEKIKTYAFCLFTSGTFVGVSDARQEHPWKEQQVSVHFRSCSAIV